MIPSKDMAQRKSGRVVLGLDTVLDLKSKRLPKRQWPKGQVAISVQQEGRIATAAGAVIDTNAAGQSRRQCRLAAHTEAGVADA